MEIPTQIDYVIFHIYCADGENSASVVSLVDKNVKKIGCMAGSDPTTISMEEVRNKVILFCDISPTPEYLEKLLQQNVKQIVVIDHHKEAIKKIENYSSSKCQIITSTDETKSGCILTWEYFFPTTPVPWFLEYISDRDTWTWKLPYSKEINTAIFEEKYIFDDLYHNKYTKEEVQARGIIIEEFKQKYIQKLLKDAIPCKFSNMFVWLYTCLPEHRSDVGSLLMEKKLPTSVKDDNTNFVFPDFVVCWQYNLRGDNFWLSLRSKNDKADVCQISKILDINGGGHRNAAGCTVPSIKDIFNPFY